MKRLIILFLLICSNSISAEVNIFSARHYDSDLNLYKKFTKQTGIKVNVVSGNDKALQKRIIEEDKDCVGDVYITSDAGRLGAFESKGMLQHANWSDEIEKKVPIIFRSNAWVGIAKRARIIFYSPERVNQSELQNLNYESLSEPNWKGRIVIRKSDNIYNQSLVSSLIENNGKDETLKWAKSLVSNMARSPKGNDRAQILAVAAGEADLAIANTYYYALMLSGQKGEEQKIAAKKVLPFFPNQNNRGTHMNISGAGLLKFSPNKSNAIKLIEFLLSEEAQKHIVNNTYEYSILENISPNELVPGKNLDFKQDNETDVKLYWDNQSEALKIMLLAGWK